ncbi:hypothetical protein AB4Z01_14960 [Inquilinus sp. YAF38]|uniref:hypothetical protein n=1 Tax=Inquilinus sp. YAF38 TaxID=3233084 RepID=UPI003F91AA75
MTPPDVDDPPEEHSLGKGEVLSSGGDSARSGAGGFEHVGNALARVITATSGDGSFKERLEHATRHPAPGETPRTAWLRLALEHLPAAERRRFVLDAVEVGLVSSTDAEPLLRVLH